MRKFTSAVLVTAGFALAAAVAVPAAFADEKNLGKHSQDEIKNACNAAGGELLGVSDLGSYGCEVASKGTMILCNKDNDCTGYTPAMTHGQHLKILNSLKLKEKPMAEGSSQPPKKHPTPPTTDKHNNQ